MQPSSVASLLVAALLTAGCGARTGLDLPASAGASADAGPTAACSGALDAGAPVAPCSSWGPAGSDAIVSGPPVPGSASYLTSVVPSGDGALVTWFITSSASTATWDTLALHLDGTPRSAVTPHLSFPTMGGVYVDVMSLAFAPPCTFGGLTDDIVAGCRFLPLDGDGHETGPAVSLPGPSGVGCGALGRAPEGFSFLEEAPPNGGTVALVTVGADGSLVRRVPLGAVPGFGSRLVLDDETFLLATFFEDDAGGDLTEEVAHYDARGIQRTPGATVTTTSGSVLLLAETRGGVLSVYLGSAPSTRSGQAVYVVPLTRDGAPLAMPMPLQVTGNVGPVYGFSLDPTPSGDALLTWDELDVQDQYHLFAMELASDGAPRGAPSRLGTFAGVGQVHAVVGGDGDHALLVYSGESLGGGGAGVHSLPIACAAH